MNFFDSLKNRIFIAISKTFSLQIEKVPGIDITLNTTKDDSFGDLSCNAAMILAKELKAKPRDLAGRIQEAILGDNELKEYITKVEIAGPGFINIHIAKKAWQITTKELLEKSDFFKLNGPYKRYLLEFVSANPTGPLHIGAGRNAIIGDVLSNILNFLGHTAVKEYYINDAGNQIKNLGTSLQIRCEQELGIKKEFPEDGYHGTYILDIAKQCITEYGKEVMKKDNSFFSNYAKGKLLTLIKQDLNDFGVYFDNWFSEKTLNDDGSIAKVLEILKQKQLIYEQDDALWFKSTKFGDDKDRVIKKQDGELTYIASDIAYHKNKFDRKFDVAIDILGQDHHGYVRRLKATMEALGFNPEDLQVILYQLVSIKIDGDAVKMSKRAGTFTTLREIIDTVGKDVARFFYLNRKADAHLEFDLNIALKKTDENPTHYIQYAYVRTKSILRKALEEKIEYNINDLKELSQADITLLKKIISLKNVLSSIASTYQTHLLAYYTIELSKSFHAYYMHNRIINNEDIATTKSRLLLVKITMNSLGICLDLLGLSKPEKM